MFEGTIKFDDSGNPEILEGELWAQYRSDNRGKTCTIKVKRIGRKSDPLRRYYFGVVVEMIRVQLREAGYNFTKDDTHQFIKQFAPSIRLEVVMPDTGEVFAATKSIASQDFTTTDMLLYLEELKQWAAEALDLYIPEPNE